MSPWLWRYDRASVPSIAAMALLTLIREKLRKFGLPIKFGGVAELRPSLGSLAGTAVHWRIALMPSGLLYAVRSANEWAPKFSVLTPAGLVRYASDVTPTWSRFVQ